MSTNGGIDVNMVPVGGSSSSADPVHSISHPGSNVLHDSTNTATKDGQKQKRKSPCVTQKLLRVVVDQGGDMTPEQIMGAGHVSRSTAFNIAKRAKNYSSVGNPVHKMPKVRNQELVLQTVASLAYHLVDFPYADMVERFCDNARCDITESLFPDKENAAVLRTTRSQRVYHKVTGRFHGRDGINTLLCVLYSPLAVCSLMIAAQRDDKEHPGHVMVLRLGGVFIVLITDSSPKTRFPLEWFMRRGNHTSAFLWLNIKDVFWLRHRGVASSMISNPIADATDASTEPIPKHTQCLEVFDTYSKLTECTITGMHFLKFLRVKADELAREGAINGTGSCHIYLRPYPNVAISKTSVVSEEWCTHIDTFVNRFTFRTGNADKVIHSIPVENVQVGVAEKAQAEVVEKAQAEVVEKAQAEVVEKAQVEVVEKVRVEVVEQAKVCAIVEQVQVEAVQQVNGVVETMLEALIVGVETKLMKEDQALEITEIGGDTVKNNVAKTGSTQKNKSEDKSRTLCVGDDEKSRNTTTTEDLIFSDIDEEPVQSLSMALGMEPSRGLSDTETSGGYIDFGVNGYFQGPNVDDLMDTLSQQDDSFDKEQSCALIDTDGCTTSPTDSEAIDESWIRDVMCDTA